MGMEEHEQRKNPRNGTECMSVHEHVSECVRGALRVRV